jgi:hypothetical protein
VRDDDTAADLASIGYALAAVQGLVTALAPGLSVAVARRLVGLSFEGAADLRPRARYRRQLRATGVGLLAAGAAGVALEAADDDE